MGSKRKEDEIESLEEQISEVEARLADLESRSSQGSSLSELEQTPLIVEPYPFVGGVTITADLLGNVAIVGREQEEIECNAPTQLRARRFTGVATALITAFRGEFRGEKKEETKKRAEQNAKDKATAWAMAGSFICVEPERCTGREDCADQAAIKIIEGPEIVGETRCKIEAMSVHTARRVCTATTRIKVKVQCPCI